jgi:hypothetical protein
MVPFTVVNVGVASQVAAGVLSAQPALVDAPSQSLSTCARTPGHHLGVAAGRTGGNLEPVGDAEFLLDAIDGIDAFVPDNADEVIDAVEDQPLADRSGLE